MDRYKENAKWLTYFAPFRTLSISAAYLTPFFLEKGLSLSEVFFLQSVFSAAVVALEVPSGWFADRFGRAFAIKLSAPVAAAAMVGYGFSNNLLLFVAFELLLAVSNSLISGVDTTLLYDSLKAEGYQDGELKQRYEMTLRHMNAFGYGGTAVGVPVAILLVHFVNISATLVADGLLTVFGAYFVFKLVEAPLVPSDENPDVQAERTSAWRAMCQLGSNIEARWLVVLGSVLSASTYLAFWLSAPYYTGLGVPVVLFSAMLAIRSLWKAVLSRPPRLLRRFCNRVYNRHVSLEARMVLYGALAGGVYFAMATGQLWLVWIVLGHDIVQALHAQPITAQLNAHIAHKYRATMNSLVNLVQRLVFAVAGPLVGLLADKAGLPTALLVTGAACSLLAFVAIARLHKLHTFR